MVDRIASRYSEEYKIMSWLTPAGATLSRSLRIPTLFRQDLVRLNLPFFGKRSVPPAAGVSCSLLLSADYHEKASGYGARAG